jgi:hypothetical protein
MMFFVVLAYSLVSAYCFVFLPDVIARSKYKFGLQVMLAIVHRSIMFAGALGLFGAFLAIVGGNQAEITQREPNYFWMFGVVFICGVFVWMIEEVVRLFRR